MIDTVILFLGEHLVELAFNEIALARSVPKGFP